MSEFEKWYDKTYPLPPTIERGSIGREAKKQARLAWEAAIKQNRLSKTENIMAIGMVRAWLKVNGYDGLYTDECGCEVDDLMPCGEFGSNCEPGYRTPCPGKEDCENAHYGPCDWHIGGTKPNEN